MMEIKVEINREQYIKEIRKSLRSSYKRAFILPFILATLLTIIDGIQHSFKYPGSLESFLVIFVICLLIIILRWAVSIYKTLKKIKKYGSLISVYTLFPEGIKRQTQTETLYFRWVEILKISIISSYMTITRNSGKSYAIPLSTFESPEQQTEFFETIQNGVAAGKATPVKHPSYWIGLLCLLPVIGFINGSNGIPGTYEV